MHSNQNNPETSYTEKKLRIKFLVIQCLHIVHLIQQHKNLIVIYRGKDCKERFRKDLKKHARKMINHEKKRDDTTN